MGASLCHQIQIRPSIITRISDHIVQGLHSLLTMTTSHLKMILLVVIEMHPQMIPEKKKVHTLFGNWNLAASFFVS
jgi:hypothetical protein